MQLPIDASKRPFRAKYLTDETPLLSVWFVFGTHADGSVDLSDGANDIFIRVPPDMAERLIAARDAFCAAIEAELAP